MCEDRVGHLATALYAKTDDLPKASPRLAPWRPAVRIAPQLTDAELVRSAVVQAMLGFTSEARWIRHARSHLQHLFPYLPKQHGYNKLLHQAAELLRRVIRRPATDTSMRVGTNFAPAPSPRTTNPWECPGTTRSSRPMG